MPASGERAWLRGRRAQITLMVMATIALSEIRKLSVAERIRLVQDIWDSVAEEAARSAPPPLTETQRQELDERIARAAAHPGVGEPWDAVKTRLLGST